MKILLDTNVLIWSVRNPERLDAQNAARIRNGANDVAFSAASVWEIAIKAALRRADFEVDAARFLATARLDFREIPILSSVAIRAASLPFFHRDPFDRLLVAQATEEDAILLTADRTLLAYGAHVHLTG